MDNLTVAGKVGMKCVKKAVELLHHLDLQLEAGVSFSPP